MTTSSPHLSEAAAEFGVPPATIKRRFRPLDLTAFCDTRDLRLTTTCATDSGPPEGNGFRSATRAHPLPFLSARRRSHPNFMSRADGAHGEGGTPKPPRNGSAPDGRPPRA